ncbi:hypothetical protein HKBW3S03_02210 [Candidatus Hakubella thermalkaliphila]|uniref:Uncharacterized protein n=1 Tax=Candidatus Hakubella thermalkaliphila TaxID=2754717 RepID=A0A6V8NQL2_9ACTN|nr:hypothetical protein HKBW3S03_02210 [Candidatus Hakubella thermalkaliphila]
MASNLGIKEVPDQNHVHGDETEKTNNGDPDLAKEIGINGRKLAIERFDVNRVGEQMVNFLQGIVSEP